MAIFININNIKWIIQKLTLKLIICYISDVDITHWIYNAYSLYLWIYFGLGLLKLSEVPEEYKFFEIRNNVIDFFSPCLVRKLTEMATFPHLPQKVSSSSLGWEPLCIQGQFKVSCWWTPSRSGSRVYSASHLPGFTSWLCQFWAAWWQRFT